jgi:hypothetical protein
MPVEPRFKFPHVGLFGNIFESLKEVSPFAVLNKFAPQLPVVDGADAALLIQPNPVERGLDDPIRSFPWLRSLGLFRASSYDK